MRPARPPVSLAVPRINFERVIRTTVGLRPHRDSGFVLKPEKIHDAEDPRDFTTMASAAQAYVARLGLRRHGRRACSAGTDPERKAAVLGCGSPGLTAARQLQRRGFDVIIYAMTVPPDTTSNMSWAGFTPAYRAHRQPEPDARLGRAVSPEPRKSPTASYSC